MALRVVENAPPPTREVEVSERVADNPPPSAPPTVTLSPYTVLGTKGVPVRSPKASVLTTLWLCGRKEVARGGLTRGDTASTTQKDPTSIPGTPTHPLRRTCWVGLNHPHTSPEHPRRGRHATVSVMAWEGAREAAHTSPPV